MSILNVSEVSVLCATSLGLSIALGPSMEFSLWRGGLLYRIARASPLLSHDPLDVTRRSLALALVGWVPFLVLALLDRLRTHHWDPLVFSLPVHTRWLFAVPALFLAERLIDQRVDAALRYLRTSGVVRAASAHALDELERRATVACDSRFLEGLLLVLAICVSALQLDLHASLAHWWHTLVSLSLSRYLVLRWLFRWIVWTALLGRLSRFDLCLVATHPDRAGGLGILSLTCHAFSLVFVAFGAVFAAGMTMDMWAGVPLASHIAGILVYVGLSVGITLLPLFAFLPVLARAKRVALYRFGLFAQNYVDAFEGRWLHESGGDALGSPDIQSLADLGNAYEVVKEMRVLPLSKQLLIELVVVALLPILPLYLISIDITELAGNLLKAVF